MYILYITLGVIGVLIIIGILIGLAISKSRLSFQKRANQIQKGMTLEEVLSIMGEVSFVEGSKYRWEDWTPRSAVQ
ncbi:MAG: hypothetical protein FWG51_01265 [Firmicutes bacterium]|nr:hypothetical protein [Bacillota bacterium]